MTKTFTSGIAIATALLAASAAHAQTDPALSVSPAAAGQTAAEQTTTDAQDVLVIGTRRTDRSSIDSASPVDVIGAVELQAQPAANMLDVVKNLVPSFFVPQNTISDASTFVRAPSLRGLSADQILVMINGKRYNRSALVTVATGSDTALSFGAQGADIGNIPSIAVGNLQILRDGATAQYGSDAIAGVINYQIREDAGFELQGTFGQTYRDDGDRYQIAAYAGVKLGERGFASIAGEYYDEDGTSRGATRPIAVVLAQQQPGIVDRIPNYPGPAQVWGSSPSHGHKVFGNAAYEIADGVKLYGTVNYAHSNANQSFNYRSPINAPTPLVVDVGAGTQSTRSPGANGAFNNIYLTPCPTGNVTCPAGGFVRNGGAVFNYTSIYPGGFTPRFLGDVQQLYGTVGFKGDLGSFTYDLSGTLARNTLSLSMYDSISPSFGPQSQTSFFFGKLIQRERNANLDLTYPLNVGFASVVTLSGGAEYRREEYETTVGDVQSYAAGPYARQPLYDQVVGGVYNAALNGAGQQIVATQSPAASGYGGVSPVFAGKNRQESYGVYVGAEADIVEALSAGIAGRYEHYETFGGRFVGKANFILHLNDVFALRGTAGTGFHAPSPGQNNTQILTTAFSPGGDQVQTGTYPVTSDIAQYYGATSLKPEKSVNFGGGIVISPSPAITLTIDGYSIKINDRIGLAATRVVTDADVAALPSLASVGVGGEVNYFTNGFDTRTNGVDVVASYRTTLADGQFRATVAYNYNRTKVTDFDPTVINADQRADIANVSPNHRANLGLNYEMSGFSINARENFYSSWIAQQDYPGQRFGSKFTSDLDVSYTIAEHYTLTVGANNLFNEYPDRIAPTTANPIYALTNSTADGQIYPRNGGPFGINGGFYYARLRVKY